MQPRSLALLGLVTAWAAVVVMGGFRLASSAASEGPQYSAPALWPVSSRLEPSRDSASLVLFLHPQCPCSRSTLENLARVMAAPGFRARIDVLLILPKDGLEDWSESDIANQARALPGVCVTVDQSGHEARLFGAATSGHVVVYDSAGRLVFQGGITPLRGHQGDCAGTAAVIAACRDEKPGVFGAPVYGCVLFDAPRVVEPQQPETCLCPDREGQP